VLLFQRQIIPQAFTKVISALIAFNGVNVNHGGVNPSIPRESHGIDITNVLTSMPMCNLLAIYRSGRIIKGSLSGFQRTTGAQTHIVWLQGTLDS
jgi:hypothetical protein